MKEERSEADRLAQPPRPALPVREDLTSGLIILYGRGRQYKCSEVGFQGGIAETVITGYSTRISIVSLIRRQLYTRAAPNTTSFRAEPCTSPPPVGARARPSAHRRCLSGLNGAPADNAPCETFWEPKTVDPHPINATHPAQAAPRSVAACRRTAAGSDTPRPAGASSTVRVLRAVLRFSPAAAGGSSRTTSRFSVAALAVAIGCPGCRR